MIEKNVIIHEKSKIEKYVDAFLISTLAYLLQPFKKSYKAEYTLFSLSIVDKFVEKSEGLNVIKYQYFS